LTLWCRVDGLERERVQVQVQVQKEGRVGRCLVKLGLGVAGYQRAR
jgi:hypothetical protein